MLAKPIAIVLLTASLEAAAVPEWVTPAGQKITPTAAPHARVIALNPGLSAYPNFTAGQAISLALSPDHTTLLALTSGYNRNNDAQGKVVRDASNEYVFIYSVENGEPRQRQVLKIANTFAGLTFSPDGRFFYVSGGVDDSIHTFALQAAKRWAESGRPIKLGHKSGLVLRRGPGSMLAGGLGISADGRTLVAANVYNDSISIVDVASRAVLSELDLRPGGGVAGGEYPFWVAVKGNSAAFVSSVRDREVVVVDLGSKPSVTARIKLTGNPNKMLLNRSQSLLFAACDNSDQVIAIDTATNKVIDSISTVGPESVVGKIRPYTGSAPNDIALSPDEKILYVTNGGSNSVAVIQGSTVIGLIPTGWYPNAVAVSRDGAMLYVANGKSLAGPNPINKVKVVNQSGTLPGADDRINSQNQYIFQLEKAGLLFLPVPDIADLNRLTQTVAANNSYVGIVNEANAGILSQIRERIKHVIYIIKENRTYDQVLGDLGRGNGDPKLTEFGEPITPNFHKLARGFVDLDNFFDSGEVSGDGWPWSTAGRESDFGVKAVPLNYAGRGTQYEYEGPNRDINVGIPSTKERRKANPKSPDDDDLLPGAVNVAEPDGPLGSPPGKGYIWDAVLRAGLTFREYGCMSDTAIKVRLSREPFKDKVVLSVPANPELLKFGDPYFRGFDTSYPDFYREREWEREFDLYAASGDLPNFEIVQLQEDHMGDFGHAIDGVNTPERQQADNDYATARLIDKVAHSPFKYDTLIFILEDDAQDGPDHVDAHRSTGYVVGPYVKHGAVVSNYYTTVSMVRTIEDVLGLNHLNLNTATQQPMSDVFDLNQGEWDFKAEPSAVLSKTRLPIPRVSGSAVKEARDASYWARKTAGFDFTGEDRVNAEQFNRVIWEGLKDGQPYPVR